MQRTRVSGFVIGKDLVRGEATWKVRVKDESSPFNKKKLHVASVLQGVTLSKGMDVKFSISPQSHAIDVGPPGVYTEGNPDMRKYVWASIAALTIAIVFVAMSVFKPHHHPTIRGFILEYRAENILNSIRNLTADQIISDEVIRAAVRGDDGWGPGSLRSASWSAREAVFMSHQCQIFSIGFDRSVEEICLPAGGALYHEGSSGDHGKWVEENDGIPAFLLSEFFPPARAAIYETARNHLMTPANIRAVYTAKHDIIIDEYKRLSDENKQAFIVMLTYALESFEQYLNDDTARVKYANSVRLENEWREYDGECCEVFSAWQDAESDLAKYVVNLSFYQFAGRRHAEGGEKLVSAYAGIIKNLLEELTT